MSKKYKYVVVSGCSFSASDSSNLPKSGETYGDVVAEHFGAKFYNLVKSGGSLQRMNRKILEWCGENKDKFKDTLVIVGLTSYRRIEVWNNKWDNWYSTSLFFQDPELDWNKILKVDWSEEERKNYFINFYNDNAQITIDNNILIGLQSFLTLNSIDHIFFDALAPPNKEWNNLVSSENWYKHPEYEFMGDFTNKNPEMRASKDDDHPNKKAHKYWAECLLEYIDEKV
jgi:hypothetical protein